MAERKNLTVFDLHRAILAMPHDRSVLVDKVDGVEENFAPANYIKMVEFGGVVYLAIGRTMRPEGVD